VLASFAVQPSAPEPLQRAEYDPIEHAKERPKRRRPRQSIPARFVERAASPALRRSIQIGAAGNFSRARADRGQANTARSAAPVAGKSADWRFGRTPTRRRAHAESATKHCQRRRWSLEPQRSA